ncbi:cyclopropane fatty acyl phospholipid synthase [Desulforhabdus amnigena]|uniref:Cyclopropane-fatty-acyl-phospholipid synthase n=1 Tax=Desulforhabdus amnigena TaxID=40218 RepID=A0A9W6FUQ1_9BACT|nr:cyclopropane fatty acyl phospholipid synthase [Desulforhabdus amnigena]NLJ27221.1 cyclopropane fatty acyl phospholipid synthase [Deltaproteobacteria bacterium]GLI35213.1 cyclopropane-fatty-acyl-phospholipid synthase [Desulforhabdus amnigena]
MFRENFRKKIQELLTSVDIEIGGNRPWDIQIHNDEFYPRLFQGGSLALGESYMDGWWDCSRLDEFFFRILRSELDKKVKLKTYYADMLKARLLNLQKPSRNCRDVQHHYDIGNNLYRCMLDDLMIYSCGYWETASTLEEAQISKLDLVCRKLDLQPGMEVLDIGCGWGGTAKFAAEKYHVKVVGITVSKQQAEYAKELCRSLPVDIRLQDYRSIDGTFDRIVSIGMFEHVGYKNYPTLMHVARKCLKEDGLFLLHTIGGNESVTNTDPWIDRYIFPHSMLPSAKQICSAVEGIFVLEDWHSFGADYDKTLMHWFRNFHESWEILKKDYDERFYRMWKYYLLSCAASFRARMNQLWQVVLSPKGVLGGYKPERYIPFPERTSGT